jgi:hypothetical protein
MEVYAGNTHEASTLEEFLDRVERRWGRARRTWLMDRGIPAERTLEKMRARGIDYLAGTPKGRLGKLERQLLDKPWVQARETVAVKLLAGGGELYLLAESKDRVAKERAMRRRKLKRLWARLGELRARKQLSRDALLLALGAAKKEAGRAWRLVQLRLPGADETVTPAAFNYQLDHAKLRQTIRRQGRYLLRSNMQASSPELVWGNYLLLTRIEQAFKELKSDLAIRPVYHQHDKRIEAHIFVSFLAYRLHATLTNLARRHAGGLTARAILEKLSTIVMIDAHLPTTDRREILLSRYTEPDADVELPLNRLNLRLPTQPPPRIYDLESESP